MSNIRETLAMASALVALIGISAPVAHAATKPAPPPPVKTKPVAAPIGKSEPTPAPKKPAPAPKKPASAPKKPAPALRSCTRERADSAVNRTAESFSTLRQTKPWKCDWTSDGCSSPMPPSWRPLFKPACLQHDFGYRNYGHGLALGSNEAVRDWIDGRQLTEMKRICEREFLLKGELLDYAHCETAAEIVWAGLRHFGRDAFYHG